MYAYYKIRHVCRIRAHLIFSIIQIIVYNN